MKILIIDNNIDPEWWGSKNLCRLALMAPNATVYVRRAPQGDLPKSPLPYDRIIVSGSKTSSLEEAPWITELLNFVKKTVDHRIPYLGVCYGHQTLVRALGGLNTLRQAKNPEFGWTHIEVTQPSPLLKDMPSSFYSFSAHFEEVSRLPQGMKNLAQSKDCAIQACQLEDLPVFGIQFHPEKTLEEAKKILKKRKEEKNPPVLLHPTRSDELYNPKLGETLFRNFLSKDFT